MKYPNFLKQNDLVGITALSSGMGNDLLETKISLNHLKEYYKLIITPNVYGSSPISSSKEERIKELNELLEEDIKLLINFRGGDYLYEILDKIDFNKIKKKNIWVMGYSDPTSLLYILTTKYDLATIYGFNGKSFDSDKLLEYQLNCLDIVGGKGIIQKSFNDRKTVSINGNFKDSGRIIGGCLDVLKNLIGTSYDNTLNFINKYMDDGIIWYFDIYSMSSIDVYLTLLQLDNIGWFKYTKTIIFGSVLFPLEDDYLKYQDVYRKVFPNKNVIYDANIGHVKPVFTIINGSIANVDYQNSTLMLEMKYKE